MQFKVTKVLLLQIQQLNVIAVRVIFHYFESCLV